MRLLRSEKTQVPSPLPQLRNLQEAHDMLPTADAKDDAMLDLRQRLQMKTGGAIPRVKAAVPCRKH